MPTEYSSYSEALKSAREGLFRERAKFVWFRKYDAAVATLREVLAQGADLQIKLADLKTGLSDRLAAQIDVMRSRISGMKKISNLINEGRLIRKDITKAEMTLLAAKSRFRDKDFIAAEKRLNEIPPFLKRAEEILQPIVSRYGDRHQINAWKTWVDETIRDSRDKGSQAIVIDKSERTLILYKKGQPIRTYSVGLGRNGTKDKLHAGDQATPEGKYFITKKIPNSKYYKALLINYPNDEDRQRFANLKKRGIIPKKAGIGGLIEIHGGGRDSMTYGCIGMDDNKIDELYSLVDAGTPVTIVGAMSYDNTLSISISDK